MNVKNNYPYIIAEIGGNHNGDMDLAKKLIDEAIDCGVNAVKFQLYDSDLFTYDHLKELNDGKVKLENIKEWKTKEQGLQNIFDQVKKYAIQEDEHIELFQYCREKNIDYTTTVMGKKRIDFLVEQKVSFLKIASCDVNNIDFILYCINTGLPVVISTGLASLGEIENIVSKIPKDKKQNITFLHCVSLYPPKESEINLTFMNTIKDSFGVNVGYSDHSLGYSIPLAAISLGAKVIEKHFTLDKEMPGWDHKVSANPEEMKIICEKSKKIVDSLGNGIKHLSQREIDKKGKFRRSATTIKKMRKGDKIKKKNIVYKRPGTGISPSEEKYLLGRKLKVDKDEDETLFWKDLL